MSKTVKNFFKRKKELTTTEDVWMCADHKWVKNQRHDEPEVVTAGSGCRAEYGDIAAASVLSTQAL